MAKKVSELSSAGTLDGTELMMLVQAAANKKVTIATLATYFGAGGGGGGGSGSLVTGDYLITTRNPGAGYLAAGSVALQGSYSALYALVGLYPDLATTDWATVSSPGIGNAPNDFAFGSGVWVAACASGTAYRSTDGGLTFSATGALGLSTQTMNAVDTDGSGVWIIGGNAGSVARSTDAGLTWSSLSTATGLGSSALNGIATDRAGRWVIVAASGLVKISSDNGVTWASATSTGGLSTNAVNAVATNRAGVWIMAANTGALYRSTDNGANWTEVSAATGSYPGRCIATDRNGNWFVGGQGSANRYSTDNGLSWQIAEGFTGSDTMIKVAYADGIFLATSSSNPVVVMRSRDKGKTWNRIAPVSSTIPFGALAANDAGIWLATIGTSLYRSSKRYSYNTSTQFAVPPVNLQAPLMAYIKT